jgi:hypothetical protein
MAGEDGAGVSEIRDARIVSFYLFDVAETIDLDAVTPLVRGAPVAAPLAPKQPTPDYLQYERPPLTFDGALAGAPEIDGFTVRVRVYDYGVISIALSRSFTGDWATLLSLGQTLMENAALEQRVQQVCASIAASLKPALAAESPQMLSEDYLVYVVHELEQPWSADELLASRGTHIAALLRGERERLSAQEESSVLQRRISYLASDLVVPTWNAAFVYDTPDGARSALDILEFANSQLLEFRHYDDLLERELTTNYARLQQSPRGYSFFGAHHARAARQVHSRLIEINELTDRTENALKFIGDIYAARLFALVADRLALATWKEEVEKKLQTLDEIYRFALEQSNMSRGQALELTIVVILVLELVLIFLGIM